MKMKIKTGTELLEVKVLRPGFRIIYRKKDEMFEHTIEFKNGKISKIKRLNKKRKVKLF